MKAFLYWMAVVLCIAGFAALMDVALQMMCHARDWHAKLVARESKRKEDKCSID